MKFGLVLIFLLIICILVECKKGKKGKKGSKESGSGSHEGSKETTNELLETCIENVPKDFECTDEYQIPKIFINSKCDSLSCGNKLPKSRKKGSKKGSKGAKSNPCKGKEEVSLIYFSLIFFFRKLYPVYP